MKPRIRRLERKQLPALAEFARAYLHEDAIAEYGSAEHAVVAYIEDVGAMEQRQLRIDLARLADTAVTWPHARLLSFFTHDLRASWAPSSRAQIRFLEIAAKKAQLTPRRS
jgi:hypothetical protein